MGGGHFHLIQEIRLLIISSIGLVSTEITTQAHGSIVSTHPVHDTGVSKSSANVHI